MNFRDVTPYEKIKIKKTSIVTYMDFRSESSYKKYTVCAWTCVMDSLQTRVFISALYNVLYNEHGLQSLS